ncbi:MAG: NTP transferase domain-containing protein [Puniceicoccaceae bacterium]
MIRNLYLSPGHNYRGHHGSPAGEHPILEALEIECEGGRGIVGDRYFDHEPDFKGQITFFEWENLVRLWEELGVARGYRDPAATRRNALVQGMDLNALIGQEFEIQGVRFLGTEECKPCYWMNRAIHPGAEEWMRGRGGLRARILRGGKLKIDRKARVTCHASVLLVGGKSTRMGTDKALVEVGGQPLWSRQVNLLEALAGPVSISSGQPPPWLPTGKEWIGDQSGIKGPLGGLLPALSWARERAVTHLLALAVDLPRMREEILRTLVSESAPGRGAVFSTGDNFEPLVAVYPIEAIKILEEAVQSNEWKLQKIVREMVNRKMVDVFEIEDFDPFHNMNSPADLP